ncbi:MAG: DUF1722 domain-containing protein [Myxococcaceae bacterium]|nr:DUF1722 domain-containing protein [Myxococcaceae bacterium]
MAQTRLRLGVSACLLGRAVRYDGGHRRNDFIADTLGGWVDFVEVCPEVELGLGVPRPTLHLAGTPSSPRMVVTATGEDLSDRMRRFSSRRVRGLEDLDGYILKRNSPSCGPVGVPVFKSAGGSPRPMGRGLFAEALAARYPLLPIVDESHLQDRAAREHFIERIFAFHRLRRLCASTPTAKDLVAFHTAHKMTLFAHHPAKARELGRLVAKLHRAPSRAVLDTYAAMFMTALGRMPTRRQHVDVLQHLQGHLKHVLDAGDRTELMEAIDAYRNEQVPLLVPLTLLRHHIRRHPVDWIAQQTYLHPDPAELALRQRA